MTNAKIHFFIFVNVLETPQNKHAFSKHVCILIALIRIITYSRYIEPIVQWDDFTSVVCEFEKKLLKSIIIPASVASPLRISASAVAYFLSNFQLRS